MTALSGCGVTRLNSLHAYVNPLAELFHDGARRAVGLRRLGIVPLAVLRRGVHLHVEIEIHHAAQTERDAKRFVDPRFDLIDRLRRHVDCDREIHPIHRKQPAVVIPQRQVIKHRLRRLVLDRRVFEIEKTSERLAGVQPLFHFALLPFRPPFVGRGLPADGQQPPASVAGLRGIVAFQTLLFDERAVEFAHELGERPLIALADPFVDRLSQQRRRLGTRRSQDRTETQQEKKFSHGTARGPRALTGPANFGYRISRRTSPALTAPLRTARCSARARSPRIAPKFVRSRPQERAWPGSGPSGPTRPADRGRNARPLRKPD